MANANPDCSVSVSGRRFVDVRPKLQEIVKLQTPQNRVLNLTRADRQGTNQASTEGWPRMVNLVPENVGHWVNVLQDEDRKIIQADKTCEVLTVPIAFTLSFGDYLHANWPLRHVGKECVRPTHQWWGGPNQEVNPSIWEFVETISFHLQLTQFFFLSFYLPSKPTSLSLFYKYTESFLLIHLKQCKSYLS